MTSGFFKKYGKMMMAVFGSLLMITFVLNSFNKNNGGGRDASETVRGKMAGKDVTQGEVNLAGQDVGIVTALSQKITNYRCELINDCLGISGFQVGDRTFGGVLTRDPQQRALHFFLLLEEARRYGLVPSRTELEHNPQDIDAVVTDAGIDDEKLQEFLDTANVNRNTVRRAVADFRAVALQSLADTTLAVSVPELQHLAVDTGATMQVRYIVLDTSGADKMSWTPTPADQQKQLDAYKDVLAPEDPANQTPALIAGHHYPFGYKFPDQIKLEVLAFDWQQVRDSLKAGDEEYLEARKEYVENPGLYHTKIPETAPATNPATAPSAATEQAATSEPSPTTQPFEVVKDTIVKEILDRKADQKVKDMTDAANAALKAVWDRYQDKEDTSGYYSVPAAQWPSYEAIATDIEKQFGVRPKLEIYGKDWLSAKSIAEKLQDGIGNSGQVLPGVSAREMAPLRFTDLAMNIHELQSNPPARIAAMHLQVGVDGPVLLDPKHNAYIYRVTAASPTHAPASVAEVQDAIIHDLRRVELQRENLKLAATLADEAGRIGLDTVGLRHKLPVQLTPLFSRLKLGDVNRFTRQFGPAAPMAVQPLGIVPEFTDAAFNLMVRAVDQSPSTSGATQPAKASATAPAVATTGKSPMKGAAAKEPVIVSATQDASASSAKPAFETTVADSDSRLQVFVLELFHAEPTTMLRFDVERANLRDSALGAETREFLQRWYDLEAVATRLGFTPSQPFKTDTSGNDMPAGSTF